MTLEQEIAMQIGQFFLGRNNDDYVATQKQIESLRITNIVYKDSNLHIHTSRPGLLIGRRGETIEALKKYLGREIRIEEEGNWLDWLVPVDPGQY